MKMSKSDNEPEELDVDMTPMIDVTFLLIVFFMIVIDLTQQDIVQLQLPKAEHGTPDKNPEKNRQTINVTWDKVQRKSTIIWKRQEVDYTQLGKNLFPIATGHGMIDPQTRFSKLFVLIRCDRDAPFKTVQEIMQVCATPELKIYKVMLAARDASGQK